MDIDDIEKALSLFSFGPLCSLLKCKPRCVISSTVLTGHGDMYGLVILMFRWWRQEAEQGQAAMASYTGSLKPVWAAGDAVSKNVWFYSASLELTV